jgi:hypothetical protein
MAEEYWNKAITAIKQARAEPVGHRDGYWCADLTCKKCYSADFRLKHTTPPAAPIPDAITDNSESPEFRAGWNECRELTIQMGKP